MSGAAQGYIGRNPGDSQVTIARQQFTPTGVTTDFTFTSGYTAGYMDVYINGAKILVGRDYTATNGSTVGLTSAAQSGDIIELVAYKAFNVNNVAASNGNFDVGGILTVDDNTALSGQLEVTGVTTFTGAVENVVSTGIVTALQFSGNITGVAATFTGDVSIGGTLTYEDVINVDSVGVVTARAGLKVTGGTSYFAGAIAAAGAITGTASTATNVTVADESSDTTCFPTFVTAATGNLPPKTGSNLTFNSATGQLNATKFVGDGSSLSGVVIGVTTEALTTAGATVTLDLSKDDHKITKSGTYTITCTGGSEATSHTLRIVNSGISTVGFSTYFLFPSGGTPNLPTANGAISLISFTVHRAGASGISTQLMSGASVNFS